MTVEPSAEMMMKSSRPLVRLSVRPGREPRVKNCRPLTVVATTRSAVGAIALLFTTGVIFRPQNSPFPDQETMFPVRRPRPRSEPSGEMATTEQFAPMLRVQSIAPGPSSIVTLVPRAETTWLPSALIAATNPDLPPHELLPSQPRTSIWLPPP